MPSRVELASKLWEERARYLRDILGIDPDEVRRVEQTLEALVMRADYYEFERKYGDWLNSHDSWWGEGGLHLDDVALRVYLCEREGLRLWEDYAIVPEDDEFYHWGFYVVRDERAERIQELLDEVNRVDRATLLAEMYMDAFLERGLSLYDALRFFYEVAKADEGPFFCPVCRRAWEPELEEEGGVGEARVVLRLPPSIVRERKHFDEERFVFVIEKRYSCGHKVIKEVRMRDGEVEVTELSP